MNIRSLALTGAFMFSATALAACGGDSSSSTSTGSGGAEKTTTAAPASTATLDSVLECLTAAGVDAKDQTNSTGDVVGIDYPGGRTVIAFQASASEADAAEIVVGTEGLRVGNVVVSFADDPAAATDKPAIQACLS